MQRRAAASTVRRLGDRRQILPVLRLPTPLFPAHPLSLAVGHEPDADARYYNVLSPAALHETWEAHGGRLVALAWGATVGVELRLLEAEAAHLRA